MAYNLVIQLLLITFVILLIATAVYWISSRERKHSLELLFDSEQSNARRVIFGRLDNKFTASRLGTKIEVGLRATFIKLSPLATVITVALLAIIGGYIAYFLAGVIAGVVILFLIPFGFKSWLEGQKEKRLLKLIGQLPQIARILANSTSSGLSINSGMRMVSTEMAAPASEEFGHIIQLLDMGVDLDVVLEDFRKRNPSKEVGVLIQTIIIQSKVGGKLVSSLTDIANTLEDRKELVREAVTATSGARYSGYMVVAIGLLAPIAISSISGSSIDELLHTTMGRIIGLIGGGLMLLGLWLMSKVAQVRI